MFKHEVFISDNHEAAMIAEMFNGNIQAYNVGDDEEAFVVTFISRLSHKKVVDKVMPFSFEEVISEEI
ncbi:hypothetical protein [Klebsiella phage IME184]|uniref:Uncharacterized protein n=1 Tax=Klebsiella phage IME184 TaxID=2860373 RepID=A0AC61NAI0_9CAUD|nr:hypothetical protein [Klebsiella phage IME184]